LAERQRLPDRKADFPNHAVFPNSFWRIAALAATGFIGTASHAVAATSILWSDSDRGIYLPSPVGPQRPHKVRHHQGSRTENRAKESVKPQGPLIIAISIERQSLKLYDANGLFAQTAISTGMHGHPTPMGVFSIIQKQKFHRSNIYSNAPMPYMQRITWSGVAMHAGVLPGYPASHGCIRMPMGFAVKMYGWTRMGARVVVTPGEMTPSSFSHPLLTAQKPAPTPVAPIEPPKETPSATKSDKAIVADATATREATASATREHSKTADASDAAPQSGLKVTMSDAAPPASGAPSIDRTTSTELTTTASAEAAVKSAARATQTVTAEETKAEPGKTDDRNAAAPRIDATQSDNTLKSDTPKLLEKSDDKTAAANEATTTVPDIMKDPARRSDAEKPAASKPDPAMAPKRAGQISVFVSRKDGKLYVRQNFAPLFEVPVTIAPSDRPLGTHVFTAQVDQDDASKFHWSVVSLPATRHAERRDDDERVSRRRKGAAAVEVKPTPIPDSPAEALDRITIPDDAMAKIADALSTGASIIVSDQGIAAGETGEGTDFIVSLR
jgi:lipoprotein-anchoring transpeptidase ErfK/SrfK